MKKISFIYQMLFPYIFIVMTAALLALGASKEMECMGILVITLLSIFFSLTRFRKERFYSDQDILKEVMIVKLAPVPVYVITFIMGLMGIPLLAVAGIGIFYITMAFVLDLFFIINSGIFASLGIIRTRQGHKVILCILSFLFVLDVIVSIWMYVKNGKGN